MPPLAFLLIALLISRLDALQCQVLRKVCRPVAVRPPSVASLSCRGLRYLTDKALFSSASACKPGRLRGCPDGGWATV